MRDCLKNTEQRQEILPEIAGFPSSLDDVRFGLIEYAMTCADNDKNLRPYIISICEKLEMALSQISQ